LHRAEDTDIATKVSIVAMPSHVSAEINFRRSVGTADGAAHPSLWRGASRMRSQMSLKCLLNRACIWAQWASILFSLVPDNIPKRWKNATIL